MKVLVTVSLNRLSSLHIPSWYITLFTVCYFLSEILRIPDNGRKRSLRFFTLFFFFKKLTEIPPLNCKEIFKEFHKSLEEFMVGQQRKFCFLDPLKCYSSFCEYIFNINIGGKINKISIGRKSTSSQWLIHFRKIGHGKLSLQS